MTSHFSFVDVIVLFIYVIGVVGFGAWFMRRNKSPEDFTAAGRSLPGWAVGLSILGTYVSSISFIALPGKALAGNWNPWVFSLSLPLAAWAAVKFFVPLYREHGDISAYSYLEKRFGPWARNYAVVCYLLTQLARMGSIMFLVALALNRLLGWDVRFIIIGMGVLVFIYTVLGGIEAVIWTDVVQSIVLVGGALVSAVILMVKTPGGVGQLFAIAAEQGKFSLGGFGVSLAEPTFWVVLVYGVAINLQNFGIDQNYIQRYHAARSMREARKSVLVGSLLYIPVSALFIFIGTQLFAFYSSRPGLLPEALQVVEKADKVFPHFIVTQLPVGLVGLLIAAVFAAAMSTVDSSINSASTLILTDFYKRYVRPEAGDRESMKVLRVSTFGWSLLGTVAALLMIDVGNILDVWWKLSGIFGGGMLGLFLLGYFARRVKNAAAAVGTVLGILVIMWMTFSPALDSAWSSPFHSFLIPVIGTLSIFLVGLLLSGRKDKAGYDISK